MKPIFFLPRLSASLLAVALGFGAVWAQGPTLIDAIDVVEGEPSDTVMVAEWYVTNASDNPMTVYVERNVIQVVDPMNLPYVAGGEGAYERFCWAGTCYPYGSAESAVPLALTLEPMDTTGINAFGAEDWMIADYYPNGVSRRHGPGVLLQGDPARGARKCARRCCSAREPRRKENAWFR